MREFFNLPRDSAISDSACLATDEELALSLCDDYESSGRCSVMQLLAERADICSSVWRDLAR
jgi:hypothetical protein